MASFVIELPLFLSENNYNVLNKRFKIGEHIYNVLVKHARVNLKRMIETKEYKIAIKEYLAARTAFAKNESVENKMKLRQCISLLGEIRKPFGLSENDFHSFVLKQQHMYQKYIDSNTAQKIASTVWKSQNKCCLVMANIFILRNLVLWHH